MTNFPNMGLPAGLPEMLQGQQAAWWEVAGRYNAINRFLGTAEPVREMTGADLGIDPIDAVMLCPELWKSWNECLTKAGPLRGGVFRLDNDAPYSFWLGTDA